VPPVLVKRQCLAASPSAWRSGINNLRVYTCHPLSWQSKASGPCCQQSCMQMQELPASACAQLSLQQTMEKGRSHCGR
jgi:hypothetical protein